MDVEITLKNYRCFEDTHPACFQLRNGFTAFVGVNNSGKSSLLKFFYEFRETFRELASIVRLGNLHSKHIRWPTGKDTDEYLCNRNNRDLMLQFRFLDHLNSSSEANRPILSKAVFTFVRADRAVQTELYADDQLLDPQHCQEALKEGQRYLLYRGNLYIDPSPLLERLRAFRNTLYIGPFRNTINVHPNAAYFDIDIGQSFIKMWNDKKYGNDKAGSRKIDGVTEHIRRIFQFDHLDINSLADSTDLRISVDRQ